MDNLSDLITALRAKQVELSAVLERLRAAQSEHIAAIGAFGMASTQAAVAEAEVASPAPARKIKVSFELHNPDRPSTLHVETECDPADLAGIVDLTHAAMGRY